MGIPEIQLGPSGFGAKIGFGSFSDVHKVTMQDGSTVSRMVGKPWLIIKDLQCAAKFFKIKPNLGRTKDVSHDMSRVL